MHDDGLRTLLTTLDPKARDDLRRVLIRDQADRDAIASQLLRYRDGHGDDWADIIDMLTMHPEERRRVARLLAEIDAKLSGSEGTRGRVSCSSMRRPTRSSLALAKSRIAPSHVSRFGPGRRGRNRRPRYVSESIGRPVTGL